MQYLSGEIFLQLVPMFLWKGNTIEEVLVNRTSDRAKRDKSIDSSLIKLTSSTLPCTSDFSNGLSTRWISQQFSVA